MGSVDIGGSRASIAQQAAETLGIAYEDVKPTVVDTDSIGYTMVTGGSRTTFATGWAAIEAAEDVKTQMVERAAQIWDTSVDDVEYVDGVLSHKSDPELRMTFKRPGPPTAGNRRRHHRRLQRRSRRRGQRLWRPRGGRGS